MFARALPRARLLLPTVVGSAVGSVVALHLATRNGRVSAEVAVEPDRFRPGLYVWGNNKNRIAADVDEMPMVKTPKRHPWFDGKLLRDVAVSDAVSVAVLENGDVVQWGRGSFDPAVVLAKKDVAKARLSADGSKAIVLCRNGSMYEWDTREAKPAVTAVQVPKLWFREYIVDIAAGAEHVLALTSSGRVLTGAVVELEKSRGQFGIATFSQYDAPPAPGTLHEVKLLRDIPIAKIAAGAYHSLAQSADGQLFVFGDNTFGQLGLPYTYRTAAVPTPTQLPVRDLLPRGAYMTGPRVADVYAGGNISYFVVDNGEKRALFSMGDGSKGQLGTGSFSNSQRQPIALRFFNELTEYSETAKAVVPIGAETLSVGPTHTLGVLATAQRDVVVWGGNEHGQVGNGKRSLVPKPTPLGVGSFGTSAVGLQLVSGKLSYEDDRGKQRSARLSQRIVAGPNTTAVFTAPM